jgi:broad specificity phosphatase PhoE
MSSPNARMYLVRHAESEANINSHIIGGRTNESPLTTLGIEQSRRLGEFMLRRNFLPDFVYTSPAVRALQTAQLSLDAAKLIIEPRINDNLQELSQGDWTGLDRTTIYTPEQISEVEALGKDFKAPGGESMNEVGQRMQDAMNDIANECFDAAETDKAPVVFVYTHGLAIRCRASTLLGWSHSKTYKIDTPNASLTCFSCTDDTWSLEYLGHDSY